MRMRYEQVISLTKESKGNTSGGILIEPETKPAKPRTTKSRRVVPRGDILKEREKRLETAPQMHQEPEKPTLEKQATPEVPKLERVVREYQTSSYHGSALSHNPRRDFGTNSLPELTEGTPINVEYPRGELVKPKPFTQYVTVIRVFDHDGDWEDHLVGVQIHAPYFTQTIFRSAMNFPVHALESVMGQRSDGTWPKSFEYNLLTYRESGASFKAAHADAILYEEVYDRGHQCRVLPNIDQTPAKALRAICVCFRVNSNAIGELLKKVMGRGNMTCLPGKDSLRTSPAAEIPDVDLGTT